MWSSEYGHLEVVRALLQGGANVNGAGNRVTDRSCDEVRETERQGSRQRGSEIKSERARERGSLIYNDILYMFQYNKILNPSPQNVVCVCVCVCVCMCLCVCVWGGFFIYLCIHIICEFIIWLNKTHTIYKYKHSNIYFRLVYIYIYIHIYIHIYIYIYI
jgi:hypothetical protein